MMSEDFIHTSGDFRETSDSDFREASEEGPETPSPRFQETSERDFSVTSISLLQASYVLSENHDTIPPDWGVMYVVILMLYAWMRRSPRSADR